MAFPLTVTFTLTSTVPPEALWRGLTAVEQWPTAIASLRSAKLQPKGALAAGSVIRTRAVAGANSADRDYRVVEAEAPRYLALAVDEPAVRAVTRYEVRPHGEAESDLVVTASLDAVGLMENLRFLAWRARIMPIFKANTRERAQALVDLAERLAAA